MARMDPRNVQYLMADYAMRSDNGAWPKARKPSRQVRRANASIERAKAGKRPR